MPHGSWKNGKHGIDILLSNSRRAANKEGTPLTLTPRGSVSYTCVAKVCMLVKVGVQDLVARGYVIPGGASQRGGSGSGVLCRTLSDRDSRQSHVMPDRDGFGHQYNNFWHRPYLAQKRGTI